jgi:tetratricopeptide (TPR) repeat protein
VQVNLSLARSYRKAGGDEALADRHAERAYELAQDLVDRQPENAEAAYWLARAHQALGRPAAAAEQHRRASELRPDSVKYRRAFERMESAARSR